MATKGCTSAYATWVEMKREGGEVLAYKNIGRRVLLLHKRGFIQEIKLEGVENLHGRKDYKLTMNAIEVILPYVLTHTEDIQNIDQYLIKFKLDKELFWNLLLDQLDFMVAAIRNYIKHASLPEIKIVQLQDRLDMLYEEIDFYDKSKLSGRKPTRKK